MASSVFAGGKPPARRNFLGPAATNALRLRQALLGSAATLALSVAPAAAQYVNPAVTPMPATPPAGEVEELPTLAVEGTPGKQQSDYKADQPTIKKFTEPLLNTPQTIEAVTRKVMDDQGN